MSTVVNLSNYIDNDIIETSKHFTFGTVNNCRCYSVLLNYEEYNLSNYLHKTHFNKVFADMLTLVCPDEQPIIIQLTNIDNPTSRLYLVFKSKDIHGWVHIANDDDCIPDGYRYDGYFIFPSSVKSLSRPILELLGHIIVTFNNVGKGVVPTLVPISQWCNENMTCVNYDVELSYNVLNEIRKLFSYFEYIYPPVDLDKDDGERFALVSINGYCYLYNRNNKGYAGRKARLKMGIPILLRLYSDSLDAIEKETLLKYYSGYIQSEDEGVYIKLKSREEVVIDMPKVKVESTEHLCQDVDISGNKRENNGKVSNLFDTVKFAKPV